MSDLLVAREGGVLTLTMNRPERRNAIDADHVEARDHGVEPETTGAANDVGKAD